ncbi:hypothetical protein MRBBS_0933 [Marinobacter sp. BSs20148]|nr:hypothetical protein MRBBS_0933 [Marinobacter sp. BSs20148]
MVCIDPHRNKITHIEIQVTAEQSLELGGFGAAKTVESGRTGKGFFNHLGPQRRMFIVNNVIGSNQHIYRCARLPFVSPVTVNNAEF